MATSHGEGGGGGGAGGAFLAMSAASAEVVRPATMSNGKATLFITSPFIPVSRWACDGPRLQSILARTRTAPICAALKLHGLFNFAIEQPRLKRRQVLPFYAFVGKLHTLLKTVAAGIHLISESVIHPSTQQMTTGSPTWLSGGIVRGAKR